MRQYLLNLGKEYSTWAAILGTIIAFFTDISLTDMQQNALIVLFMALFGAPETAILDKLRRK